MPAPLPENFSLLHFLNLVFTEIKKYERNTKSRKFSQIFPRKFLFYLIEFFLIDDILEIIKFEQTVETIRIGKS